MKQDDIDRILADEPPLQPSSGFAAEVMEAVRRESEGPEPLAFPWGRVAPGLIICGVACALGIALFPWGSAAASPGAAELARQMEQLLRNETLAWAAGTLIGSLLLVRLTLRFAGRES